ncbi:MAG: oligosaccharide flippase family protein [Agathobacter sp.]|nr:oligosaccharide flippase family protein [Agathobacter sp.]
MKKYNSLKNPLLIGTALLTLAGSISRIMGFFYRIFLSRTIGAEGLGLYHLITPVLAISFAITCAGFQTAISKYVASTTKEKNNFLIAGMIPAVILSGIIAFFIYKNSLWISINILGDYRCSMLLKVASYSLVPSSVHSCINGYFYGLKKTSVPALSQLVEQLVRIVSVYIFAVVLARENISITPVHAVWGIVLSEFAGMIFSLLFIDKITINSSWENIKLILMMAFPLCTNYLLINLCSSLENILIPKQLNMFGYSSNDSLSIYGVLSGIAVPVILFPGVLFNSVCVMLLPAISEAHARKETEKINRIINLTTAFGLITGFVCTFCFLIFADYIGSTIFSSDMACNFIKRLCWLSPFMYLSGMLGSILHGLGQPKNVLFANLLSSAIKISAILILVPQYGINAYLWGLLIANIFTSITFIILVRTVRT